MATYYWVGGSGNVDTTTRTHWSTSTGAVDMSGSCSGAGTNTLTVTSVSRGTLVEGMTVFYGAGLNLGTISFTGTGTGGAGTYTVSAGVSITANMAASTVLVSGAVYPSQLDDWVFDANSGIVGLVCTVTWVGFVGTLGAKSITVQTRTDGITFAGSSTGITQSIDGSWTNPATTFTNSATGMTWDFSGSNAADRTITTNGVSFNASVRLGAATGTTTSLGSDLSVGTLNSIYLGSSVGGGGTVSFGIYNVTCGALSYTSSTATSMNFGSSTINLYSTLVPIGFSGAGYSGARLNAGTSTIILNGAGTPTVTVRDATTLYNFTVAVNTSLSFLNTTASAPVTIGFNNFTLPASNLVGSSRTVTFTSGAAVTITGLITIPSTTPLNRWRISSGSLAQTFTINATGSTTALTDVDFSGCQVSGATWSGTRLGDLGGNAGITFTSKNVYWSLSVGGTNITSGYSLSSGGAVSVNNFPLAQDMLIFDNAGLASGGTFSYSTFFYGPGIDTSTRTLPMTISSAAIQLAYCGNVYFSSAVTRTATNTTTHVFLVGGTDQTTTLYFASTTYPSTAVLISGRNNGTVKLLSNVAFGATSTAFGLSHYVGTLDLNGYTATSNYYQNAGTLTVPTPSVACTLAFGNGGVLSLRGATGTLVFGITGGSAATWKYTGTGYCSFTYTNRTLNFATSVSPSVTTIPPLVLASANGGLWLQLSSTTYIENITNLTTPQTLTILPSSLGGTPVYFYRFDVQGTSGNNVAIRSSTAGQQVTLIKRTGIVRGEYLTITDINASGNAAWYAGATSSNGGGNAGWVFSSAPAYQATGDFGAFF